MLVGKHMLNMDILSAVASMMMLGEEAYWIDIKPL